MTQIKKIIDKQGNDIYLRTHTKAVLDDNGNTVESRLQAMQDEINQAQLAVGAVPSDLTPTKNSTNWVTSGGLYNLKKAVYGEESYESLKEVDLSSLDEVNIMINSDSNKWNKPQGWYSMFLPVYPGEQYQIVAGHNGVTRYAVLKSDSYSNNTTVSTYATGYSSAIRVEVDESSELFVIPTDGRYLFFLTQIGNGETGASVYKLIPEDRVIGDIPELKEKVDNIEGEVFKDRWDSIDLSAITADYIFINSANHNWDKAAGWYSKFIPITPNGKYIVTAGNDVTRYTFLTSYSYSFNSSVDTFAAGYSFDNFPKLVAGENSGTISAPLDATYLYVLTEIGSGDTGVTVKELKITSRFDSIEEKVNVNLEPTVFVNEGVTSKNGVYATLQEAVDACEEGSSITINISGELHINSTVTIPNSKHIRIVGGSLKGSLQSIGVRRKDNNGVAKIYIGNAKPKWITVDGNIKYPASSLRDFPYKTNVSSSGASNQSVTVTFTLPISDAIAIASNDISNVWVTILDQWMSYKLRVNSIDTSTGVFTCIFNQGVGSYHRISGTKRIVIENINIPSAIVNDNKDTWGIDTFYYSGGYLYYKYENSSISPNIEIPSTETLISSYGSLVMEDCAVSMTAHDFDDLMGEGTGYRSFQSGFVINGAIEIYGQAKITGCTFIGTTNNSIVIGNSASDVNIVNCVFDTVGADAILVGKIDYISYNKGNSQTYVPDSAPLNINIIGNAIRHTGRIYQEASAIAVAYAQNFIVSRNVISDTYYTGISTGADWADTSTQLNSGGIIESNLLKNIAVGSCALADGAAIYNLGNERGMEIRRNIITGVYGGLKGSQNIYPFFFDQGSRNIIAKENIVYDTYGFTSINVTGSGRGLQFKNNIFAFPKYTVIDVNENVSNLFASNIFVWDGTKEVAQTTGGTYVNNLYYNYDENSMSAYFDSNAVIGNPGFRDAYNFDFDIIDTTHTSQIGFTPFSILEPNTRLVELVENNENEKLYLSEWIEKWNNGTL